MNLSLVLEYPIADRTAWRAWRSVISKTLCCASASMISSYYGHHYTSYKQTLVDHVSDKQETGWDMADRAKYHGETKEKFAKEAYLDIMKAQSPKVLEDGEHTKLFVMTKENRQTASVDALFLMTTPDMKVETFSTLAEEKEVICDRIVEFKCPYFELFNPNLRNDRTVKQIAEDFAKKYPHGKEGSFLQALTYTITEACMEFSTCYYFTDDIDTSVVIYDYTTDDVEREFDFIWTAAADIKTQLSKEPGDIKARTLSANKTRMSKLMRNLHLRTFITHYGDDGKFHSSNEETAEDSKN